jgi:hypothetical protein
MAYQSTANQYAFLMGSARLAVPSSSGGYVHLGAARGIKITESWDVFEVETDNTPLVEMGIKNQTVEVEGNLLEMNFQKLQRMRSGIDSFSTATFTFDSGGNVTVTPQAFYLTHVSPTSSSESVVVTIYYASIQEGLQIPFPRDDGTDVAEIPFKVKGVCQSTRTVGSQLYNIVDTRSDVYVEQSSMSTTAP